MLEQLEQHDLEAKSYIDAYDLTLAAAAADSRERFLQLLGPLRPYLERDDVYNVNVNEGDHGRIFVEAAGCKFEAPETMTRDARESLIGRIATESRTAVNTLHASLAADMPYGLDVRVQAFCPPIADWPIMLRKHAVRTYTLDDYVIHSSIRGERGKPACPARGLAALHAAIDRGDNTMISGRPNCGKSTMLGTYLRQSATVRPQARLITIQDRKELKTSHRDCLNIFALVEQARYESAGRLDRYEYGFSDALRDALRTGFDMLAWGELRDSGSAHGLLQALNTGVRGLATTIHADSALDTLYRLENLLRVSGENLAVTRRMIVRFVDFIVYMHKSDDEGLIGIGDMQRVMGLDAHGEYILQGVLA